MQEVAVQLTALSPALSSGVTVVMGTSTHAFDDEVQNAWVVTAKVVGSVNVNVPTAVQLESVQLTEESWSPSAPPLTLAIGVSTQVSAGLVRENA